MGVKKLKPTSPGRRFQTVSDFESVTKGNPEKSLLDKKKSSSGRNSYGRITSRHRGGGHKRRYRDILREIRKSTNAMPDGAVVIDDDGKLVGEEAVTAPDYEVPGLCLEGMRLPTL